MGSLMAGWNNKTPWNEEREVNRSKSSLTKEGIEKFWRERQLATEEHMKEAAAQIDANQAGTSAGTPSIEIPKALVEELEMPVAMSPDWWARSDNAFLNSPPEKEIMGKHSKYFAQFEVATKANQTSETT